MPLYALYGLTVESSTLVPGLAPIADAGPADVCVTPGELPPDLPARLAQSGPPWHVSPHYDSTGMPTLVVRRLPGTSTFHLRYGDGTEFVVEDAGRRVWCRWDEDLTPEDVATYLLGPVMGFILRQRGVTALHASTVEAGGGAVLLVGASGAGKSTTAAALAARGVRVLGDDIAPLVPTPEGFRVQPAYPHLRLWPDAAETVFGSRVLPPLTPTWDKRYLDLAAEGAFQPRALPVRAVYLLAPRAPLPGRPAAAPTRPQAALVSLVSDVYMSALPDLPARARDLKTLGALVSSVPVRTLLPHDDPARLPALCDALLEDVRALPPAGPPR